MFSELVVFVSVRTYHLYYSLITWYKMYIRGKYSEYSEYTKVLGVFDISVSNSEGGLDCDVREDSRALRFRVQDCDVSLDKRSRNVQ